MTTTPPHPEIPLMPLRLAQTDRALRVGEIHGGNELRHRLAEMGLTIGAEFELVSRQPNGPCVVRIHDAKLMLGKGMAEKIFVQPAG